jgi:hypothetical protein
MTALAPIDPRRSERHLLAALHRWARTNGWWPGYYGWNSPDGGITIEARTTDGEVVVWDRTKSGPQPKYIRAGTVQQAVDLLVAYRYLPPQWSSAYMCAEEQYRDALAGLRDAITSGSWADMELAMDHAKQVLGGAA